VLDRSARLVVSNMQATTLAIRGRLGGGQRSSRLPFWRRVTWPPGREEGLHLLVELNGYMQMLSLVKNGFVQ
jgi:hypothetical protein